MTSHFGGESLVLLEGRDLHLYNLFYAAAATSIAFHFVLKIALNRLNWISPIKKRWNIRRSLNSEGYNTWLFSFWFIKVATLLGILYMTVPIQFNIDFIEEFPALLILLPIVSFFSTWPSLSRVVKRNKGYWLASLTALFLMITLILSFKNFIDVEKVNRGLLAKSVSHTFDLQLPRTKSFSRVEYLSLVVNIYLVQDTVADSHLRVFIDNTYKETDMDNIVSGIHDERSRIDYLDRDRLAANLHIDANIPVKYVDEVKYQLRKAQVRELQYSTGLKHSIYPDDYPEFKYYGIRRRLHPHYPEFDQFLDSAESLDYTRYAIKARESLMYRVDGLKNLNRLAVHVDNEGKAYLNKQPINKDKLELLIYKFFRKYAPNAVVIYTTDEQTTYGKYIEHLDLLISQIERLRDERSMTLYGQTYESLDFYDGKKLEISTKYPENILEWTREEKRLLKLMEKSR